MSLLDNPDIIANTVDDKIGIDLIDKLKQTSYQMFDRIISNQLKLDAGYIHDDIKYLVRENKDIYDRISFIFRSCVNNNRNIFSYQKEIDNLIKSFNDRQLILDLGFNNRLL